MWLITVLSWFNRRGQFIFHVGPGLFGQLFSLNKWNHHLKTAFCIYLHYLCVILKLVWWSESFKCDKYAKKKKKQQEGGKNLFTALYIYTGAGHIIRISSKSWFISLIPFKKWNLYNVYIHSTQTDIFQVFISFNFDDYNWQLMKTPNSVSQKIRILLKTNTKKGFLEILANWKVWTWKVWACTALNT